MASDYSLAEKLINLEIEYLEKIYAVDYFKNNKSDINKEKIVIIEKIEKIKWKWYFEKYLIDNKIVPKIIINDENTIFLNEIYNRVLWDFQITIDTNLDLIEKYTLNNEVFDTNISSSWNKCPLYHEDSFRRIKDFLDMWFEFKEQEKWIFRPDFSYKKVFLSEVLYTRFIKLINIEWFYDKIDLGDIDKYIHNEEIFNTLNQLGVGYLKLITIYENHNTISVPGNVLESIDAAKNYILLIEIINEESMERFNYSPLKYIDYSDNKIMDFIKEKLIINWDFIERYNDILEEFISKNNTD